jgi:all-trans-retinol 13,14-reductase
VGPFIAAKIGLLPFVLFWALTPAAPKTAIVLALILSLAANVWRWRQREQKQVEIAGLALFTTLAAGLALAPAFILPHAVALSFFALSLAAFVSLAREKPWTADYSAAHFGEQRESPIFIGVNKALSSLWMAIFLALGFLAWRHANPVFAATLTLSGALLSIFGPRLLVRAILARKLAAQQDFDWPAPNFDTPDSENKLDVAVIGAGIGGLTAAALLAAQGLRVKVFEQHVLPGGFCHSWLRKTRHDGAPRLFRFDAGPHDFSGAHRGGSLDRLLRRLGCAEKIEWLRLDYRIVGADGEAFDPPRDWRAHVEALVRRHPGDGEGIRVCFAIMKALLDAMADTAENANFSGPLTSVDAMLAFAQKHPLYPQWAEISYAELVSRHVQGEAARAALMAIVGYISEDRQAPTCADMAPIYGYFFNGGFYPKGGTSRFSEVLAENLRQSGGEIVFKTGVRKILVEQGRAAGLVLDNGEVVRARAVVANSDPRKTFLELLDPALLPEKFRARLRTAKPAAAGFAVHLGVDYEPEGKALTFIQGELPCFIARPGLVDPDDAPPGYAAVDILTLLTHEQARDWFPPEDGESACWRAHRRSDDYLRRKEALADQLIAQAEKALPGLREHIVYRCEASPVTYARYDRSSAGAIYGVAPQGRLKGSKSPIPGLVVAGAMNFGPGVEAAALSGVWAAEALVPGLVAAPALARVTAEENVLATV